MKNNTPVILNAEQEKVVNAQDGVWIILAGPGSGKTRCLVERYKRLLIRGIPQKDILNLTFTNSAAVNMAERCGLLDAKEVFRTFHSFALDLIKKERDKLPFQLCDSVLPFELQDYDLLFDLVKVYPAVNWRTLKEKIIDWKCQNIEPDQAFMESKDRGIEYFYALAYADYEKKCRERGWLDFDSLMKETVNLLRTDEEVRNRYKRKYLAADEAQDCDAAQFELLNLLFGGNIFLVGDENQLIYSWRSAQEGNLTKFAQKYPGANILYLGTNHRSCSKLVDFFREILPVDNGIASKMTTYNEPGEHPTITRYSDEEEEADKVLAEITDPINSAVLARTNRQLFVFQRKCLVKGLKYKILGKRDFYDEKEVKKVLTLAKEIRDNRPADQALSDLINSHGLIHLYSKIGYNPVESNPLENLNALVKMAKGRGNMQQFLTFLRKLTHARKSAKGLLLSTIHQFKGREIDHVFLVGCNQGILPHKDGELNEEKRIFFVGASRAAKTLHISCYQSPSMFLNQYKDKIIEFKEAENETEEETQAC